MAAAASGSTLSRRVSEVVGVAFFAGALIWLIALSSYDPSDPVWFFSTGTHDVPANFAGRVGAFLAELSYQLMGYASYLIPAMIAVAGWHYFWCRKIDAIYTKVIGAAMLFACGSAFLALTIGRVDFGPRAFRAGGYIGEWLGGVMSDYLSRTGSVIVILALIFASLILTTQFSFGRLFSAIYAGGEATAAHGFEAFRQWRENRRKARQRREVLVKYGKKDTPLEAKVAERKTARAEKPEPARERVDTEADDEPRIQGRTPAAPAKKASRPQMAPPLPLPEPSAPMERRLGAFTLPPVSLLDAPRTETKIDERELMDSARLLEEKCREFSVEGSVVQIHPGPVVTTFEFKPDAGVKYSKVTGLMDDLCLAMQAESVLIDRIPGKSTVGIQIPNPNREAISLRELLESDAYARMTSKLTFALGKTIHGEPFMADLATMPHLLIAGSTGSGKSVGLNAILTSILYRATPDDVRMIMVDPKRLELGMYEDIPHLMTPVVVEPKKAANALRWAVREMEERYKTLAAFGVRNIEQYNRNVRAMLEGNDLPKDGPPLRPLPFIVVVVDELADLMMVAGNEVEESICRLAQMARAVGIHLILATQRPSVDVITGLIKANLPARISFRVSSKIDSRTILDSNGAEQLLGKGDMLFLPPASS
ncbi:MAG: DNA translocase FtsK 4TM domain-containing protein, partial [Vicinamibacterales bacterium]